MSYQIFPFNAAHIVHSRQSTLEFVGMGTPPFLSQKHHATCNRLPRSVPRAVQFLHIFITVEETSNESSKTSFMAEVITSLYIKKQHVQMLQTYGWRPNFNPNG